MSAMQKWYVDDHVHGRFVIQDLAFTRVSAQGPDHPSRDVLKDYPKVLQDDLLCVELSLLSHKEGFYKRDDFVKSNCSSQFLESMNMMFRDTNDYTVRIWLLMKKDPERTEPAICREIQKLFLLRNAPLSRARANDEDPFIRSIEGETMASLRQLRSEKDVPLSSREVLAHVAAMGSSTDANRLAPSFGFNVAVQASPASSPEIKSTETSKSMFVGQSPRSEDPATGDVTTPPESRKAPVP